MANKSLFASLKSRFVRADTKNEAGGVAYALAPKHALAQLAATGCFNGTFYAAADEQLATVKTLIDQVADNAFLAKLAVYSRERAMMKDMPVALLVALSKRDPALFRKAFDRVVDNGRTLRTLVQFVRSGQPWPRRHEQDALRGRGGLVCRRYPAAQPGQRGHPVRHGGL